MCGARAMRKTTTSSTITTKYYLLDETWKPERAEHNG